MKGITIKSLIIIVAASLELSSCNVLDINDTSSLSDQAIWSSETAAQHSKAPALPDEKELACNKALLYVCVY